MPRSPWRTLRGDAVNLLDQLRIREAGIAIVKPVHIREQQHSIGPCCLRHARCQPVIVAKADFRRRNAVVLVHNRHRPRFEQARKSGRGVEIAPPVLQIIERQQDLRGGETMCPKIFRPQMGQRDLPHRRGGLRIGQTGAATPGQAELRRPQRNRTRADQHDFGAVPAQPRQFLHQRSEPCLARLTPFDQQRTADLDHQPAAAIKVLKPF